MPPNEVKLVPLYPATTLLLPTKLVLINSMFALVKFAELTDQYAPPIEERVPSTEPMLPLPLPLAVAVKVTVPLPVVGFRIAKPI